MRPIKFRIWNKKKKRWHQGSTDEKSRRLSTDAISLFGEIITFGEILLDQKTDKMVGLKELNDLVALQFTGLLDKNGKEIYEGDIVRCDKQEWYRTDRSMGRDVVGKPEYQEEVIWEFEMLTMRQNDYPQYWTVIGNIYENPELLLNKAKPEEGK